MNINETLSLKEKVIGFLLGVAIGFVVLAILLYAIFQIPSVQDRFAWRVDFALTYLRSLFEPVKSIPAFIPSQMMSDQQGIEQSETPSPTLMQKTSQSTNIAVGSVRVISTSTVSPTSIPEKGYLSLPVYEKQEINNCGPATLAMHLRYYGWQGDQTTISNVIKPKREDRNVNVEELVAYVNTQTPGIEIQYRVGGDIETLKRLLAAGFPVMLEEAFTMEDSYWVNDDRWAGHYLLITGYDDGQQVFQVQDSFIGPNLIIPYDTLVDRWKSFNYVYLFLYQPDSRALVQNLLGAQWDVASNRNYALEKSKREVEENPKDAIAWFNLGTNQVYFERYNQAANAYDNAINLGLPQRMLRYQFGPFFAYFHTGRIDDLIIITEYALKRTPTSEEAKLWLGWANYRKGDKGEAIKLFNEALSARPNYFDAEYALDFVRSN